METRESPDGAETPQDFVYKTKIVVLNYLGFGPPSFDLPPSPENLSDSETESYGTTSLESTEDILEHDDNSPTPTGEGHLEEKRLSDERLQIPEVSKLRSRSSSPRPSKKFSAKSLSIKSDTQPVPKIIIDNAMRKKASVKRRSTFEMHEQYQNALRDLLMAVEEGEWSPRQRDSAENWHAQYQNAMKELIASAQKDQLGESGSIDPLCPISREAIVAERIAQIGDRIMETHGRELEQAIRTVMESNDGKISYSLFKAVLKETIKSQVPGWYHVAVTLNFTRHLALGLLWSGSRGLESVSDFATRYIEENLAETILEQGGWDAITCINLDDIDGESLSSMSSGAVSPYTPDIHSAAGPSIQSSPPVLGHEFLPLVTLKGPDGTNLKGSSNRPGVPGRDLTLKLTKLHLDQDQTQDGQSEIQNGKKGGDKDEAEAGKGMDESDGGKRKEEAAGPEEDKKSPASVRATPWTPDLMDYSKLVLASAALAGITAGMYAIMKR